MKPSSLAALSLVRDVEVITAAPSIAASQEDFGHLCVGATTAILRPSTIDGLLGAVRWANAHEMPLTPRGKGLSQSGQSIPADGCGVDLSAFKEVTVSPEQHLVRCGSGATWREVLATTIEHRLVPAVMPVNLDLSVAGVLSAGGFGSTTHHLGLVVSSVQSCGVVTGAGERVECSWTERPDVFNAVLGGAGHFGIMDHAALRLRPLPPCARTFTLLYDDFATCLHDHRHLQGQPWAHHLEGFCSAAIQGLRRGTMGRRVPFARWFYGIHVTIEHEAGAAPSPDILKGLHHRDLVLVDDDDSAAFAARYDARFEGMQLTGTWDLPHPWLECFLPFDAALEIIPRLVEKLPLFLGDGHRVLLLAGVPRPDLLMVPSGDPVVILGSLPAGVIGALRNPALAALHEAHEMLLAAGGKRYLSGWLFEPEEAAWRRHFGPSFDAWRARKASLDPAGVLTSRLMARPALRR